MVPARIPIENELFVNIGESFLVFKYSSNINKIYDNPHQTLEVRVFGPSANGRSYEFNLNDMHQGLSKILIGRDTKNDILLSDKLVSKVNSHIEV